MCKTLKSYINVDVDVDVDVDEYNQIASVMKCFRKPAKWMFFGGKRIHHESRKHQVPIIQPKRLAALHAKI